MEIGGSKKGVHSDIECHVGQAVRVDIVMEVGTMRQEVTVKGAVSIIATHTTLLGDIRYSQQIQSLPLDARDITPLYGVTAGVPFVWGNSNPETNGLVNLRGQGDVAFVIDGSLGVFAYKLIIKSAGEGPALPSNVLRRPSC